MDYFAPAKEGDVIIAETAIVKHGIQFTNAECIVWNKDKTRMIAKGYTNMYKIEPKKS